MKNAMLKLSLLICGLLIPIIAIHAQNDSRRPVSCVYSGTWQYTDSSKGSGPIRWNVNVEDICCGMWAESLSGSGRDSYGAYKITGECAEGTCDVNQSYTSGQLQGRDYYYSGKIQWVRPLSEMKGFVGNWGEKGKGKKGTFRISSISCN